MARQIYPARQARMVTPVNEGHGISNPDRSMMTYHESDTDNEPLIFAMDEDLHRRQHLASHQQANKPKEGARRRTASLSAASFRTKDNLSTDIFSQYTSTKLATTAPRYYHQAPSFPHHCQQSSSSNRPEKSHHHHHHHSPRTYRSSSITAATMGVGGTSGNNGGGVAEMPSLYGTSGHISITASSKGIGITGHARSKTPRDIKSRKKSISSEPTGWSLVMQMDPSNAVSALAD